MPPCCRRRCRQSSDNPGIRATTGTTVFELKNAVEVVQAEDGKFYVDATTPVAGSVVHTWRMAPFDTETNAQFTMPVRHASA